MISYYFTPDVGQFIVSPLDDLKFICVVATGQQPARSPVIGQLCSRRTLLQRNHTERPS